MSAVTVCPVSIIQLSLPFPHPLLCDGLRGDCHGFLFASQFSLGSLTKSSQRIIFLKSADYECNCAVFIGRVYLLTTIYDHVLSQYALFWCFSRSPFYSCSFISSFPLPAASSVCPPFVHELLFNCYLSYIHYQKIRS